MDTFKTIVEIFSALLTPLLGVIGTIVLINQHRIERYKWRLALYEKRFAVYKSTRDFLDDIKSKASVNNDELFAFNHDSRDMVFLFGDEVKMHLDNLFYKAVDLNTIGSQMKSQGEGERLNELVKDSGELFKWFMKQHDITRDLFAEYLKVDKK